MRAAALCITITPQDEQTLRSFGVPLAGKMLVLRAQPSGNQARVIAPLRVDAEDGEPVLLAVDHVTRQLVALPLASIIGLLADQEMTPLVPQRGEQGVRLEPLLGELAVPLRQQLLLMRSAFTL
jgi:hypothetical protein